MEGFLSGTLKDELIKNYRDDLDFQNLIDQVQKVSAITCRGVGTAAGGNFFRENELQGVL